MAYSRKGAATHQSDGKRHGYGAVAFVDFEPPQPGPFNRSTDLRLPLRKAHGWGSGVQNGTKYRQGQPEVI